ncbi:MAG TPA: hypothetical protein VF677_01410 [Flavobacterium sp.]|jgi:hypothetical protein
MKTTTYNPSNLELEFAKAISSLIPEIQAKVGSNKIVKIEDKSSADNPSVIFFLEDKEGDKHELVMTFIQRADK